MDTIEIETRYGLIIEACVAEALKRARIPYVEGYQYDPDCETPDFLIPNETNPKFIIECHQTNDRESLKMKILRLLSAVFEAKVYYGKEIVSVNLLFGNIDILPANNLDTFCCFYDVSFFPWRSEKYATSIKRIEKTSRELAENENHDVASASLFIRENLSDELDALAAYLKESLATVSGPKESLFPIWEKETNRINALGECPIITTSTEYKPTILSSLLLSDEDFSELIRVKNPNKCNTELKKQLLRTGLVTRRESTVAKYKITGYYELSSEFSAFIRDPYSMSLRQLCKTQIEKNSKLGFFFEDIRDANRRLAIAEKFIELISGDRETFAEAVYECLINGSCYGIEHGRCWIADLMPLVVGESHNSFNRRMMENPHYTQHIGNPYSNIVIRSSRLGDNIDVLKNYASVAVECFFEAWDEKGLSADLLDADDLASKLLNFRKSGLIKLQTLNPLYIAIESIADSLGLTAKYKGIKSVVSDMSTGKFDLYEISNGATTVLVNALYIGPSYGSDHKADEWSARRRAIGYRMKKGVIVESEPRANYIFVVDGSWSNKSIRKLHRAGWSKICQLGNLSDALRESFNIT